MSNPIRVAFVITELNVGGAEQCLANLASRLDRARFEPIVYALASRPATGEDRLVRGLEGAGIPVHFLDATSVRHAISAVRRLRQWLHRQRPHIVQSFLFHANVVSLLAAYGLTGTAIVTGVRVADPTRWRHWLERRLSVRARRIACVSQSVADFCRQRVGLPAEKLVVIPNGIELAAAPSTAAAMPADLGIPAGRHSIVCVARLHPQKGIDWLLSLSRSWMDRLPEHDLLLVGDGPQRSQLERSASRLGIAGRVHFAGRRSDVPQILAASSLLVLPSRWEGMPNVVLEGMAASLPVVALRTHGVEELLGPLSDRQTAAAGDADGFLARLLRLAADPAEAADLGQGNYQRVSRHFSLRSMVATYERLYESVMDDATSGVDGC